MADDVLRAPLVLEYPFTRTTGPVIGRFLTGLRESTILGIRRSDGSVMCPPLEYDPADAAPLSELMPVGPAGEVVSWTWNGGPRALQPFGRPFAWAMIRLDGADTPLLHAVFVDGPEAMATGMRVQTSWAAERTCHITDIAGFVPEAEALPSQAERPAVVALDDVEQVKRVRTPIRMEYTYTPGRALSRYLRAMKYRRILGDRCGDTGQVFVPPRGVSPVSGKATAEMVELVDTGYVESFNVTRVPIKMRPDLAPPYASAWIVLDGASVGFMGLVINVAPEDVRIGMQVRAVWKPDDELEESATNIVGWEPTGEPDELIDDYERIGRSEISPAGTATAGDTGLPGRASVDPGSGGRASQDPGRGDPGSGSPGSADRGSKDHARSRNGSSRRGFTGSGFADVAIVAFVQRQEATISGESEVEFMIPLMQQAKQAVGMTQQDIGFTCSGSSDFLAGQAFSFVMTIDGTGPVPPISESHVEQDGAWALYEAWVKLQCGDVDTAFVYSYGKSSPGSLRDVLATQHDPYYVAPLWPDAFAVEALAARLMLEAGVVSETRLAEIASRSRAHAAQNPHAVRREPKSVAEILAEPYAMDPLRPSDLPASADGGAVVILAAADTARELCERPAWIRGIHHCSDAHTLGVRDFTRSVSAEIAAAKAGVADDKIDIAELHAPFSTSEALLTGALGLGGGTVINPSGGAQAAHTMMASGLIRIGEAASRISSGDADRAVATASSGPCLQQNLVCVLEGD